MRIRTIKPEFWTDSVMVQLPFLTRLFFVGLWNVADDHGWLEDEPDRLRMQLFPDQRIDAEACVDELVAAGRLARVLMEDGSRWLQILTWTRHQRVDHPGKPRRPDLPYKKAAIAEAARRAVAEKYGFPRDSGAESHPAFCYYCNAEGSIYWRFLSTGRRGLWVHFSGLHLDHIVAEHEGGTNDPSNLILACRRCNSSKGTGDFYEVAGILARKSEGSRLKGREKEGNGKGKEDKEKAVRGAPRALGEAPALAVHRLARRSR